MPLNNKEQYKELIADWLDDLPIQYLAQVTDYIYMLRNKALLTEQFEQDFEDELLNFEGRKLSRESEKHVEQEAETM
jgi:hypothetical protein